MEHVNAPQTALFSCEATHALVTAYPFVMGERSLDVLRYFLKTTSCKFLILDSGIFTLMRDFAQGKTISPKFIKTYTERYIKMVKALNWPGVLVEVDCHVFPESEKYDLEGLRKMFADAGLADKTVHVWHIPDGAGAFKDMLQRFKRVSMWAREWAQSEYGIKGLEKQMHAARGLTSSRHIHMLGSVNAYTATLPDNVTADSSNWAAIGIHGHTDAGPHRIEYRRGKLTCPAHILERVKACMPRMVEVYKGHPEYKRGTPIRYQYLTYMAAGLYLNLDYFHATRKRNPGSDLSVIDPLDYKPKRKP
jgi:hypothetical protein